MDAVIISAPSGGGKGLVVEYLLETFPELFTRSISYCTREIATSEENGVHYVSISKEDFHQKILDGFFLEYEEVYSGDFYGTPITEFDRAKSENKILLLDIDVNGASRLRQILKNALFIFIDSGDDLLVYQNRIIDRGRSTDTIEKIRKRVEKIPIELQNGRFAADEVVGNHSDIEVLKKLVYKVLVNRNIA